MSPSAAKAGSVYTTYVWAEARTFRKPEFLPTELKCNTSGAKALTAAALRPD